MAPGLWPFFPALGPWPFFPSLGPWTLALLLFLLHVRSALVPILTLPLGVLLGWLFERRGSLATPIAVHAVFNLVSVSLMLPAVAVA